VKPAAFAYHRAGTVAEAAALLDRLGPMARPLAGGQSLVPMLSMRLARPEAIIDLNGVEGLAGISAADGEVHIGALTRHRELERSSVVAERLPLLAAAVRFVGDRQVRTRGTLGGSLAHADPTAELAVAAVALGGSIVVRGAGGERVIDAPSFFAGPYMTELDPGELIVEVRFPAPEPRAAVFAEHARRHGDFAVLSVAATGVRDGSAWHDVRIALGGVADTPLAVGAASAPLEGTELPADAIAAAAQACAHAADPPSDVRASAEYRRHLIPFYVTRALMELREQATPGAP
jgi:carbon-monoxide dehydrogenase medium subunit